MDERAAPVDLFVVDLDAESAIANGRFLSDAERARADRFATAQLASRYAAMRGTLRVLLNDALGADDPRSVPLVARPCTRCGEPHGKPALAGGDALCFNVSHSDSAGLVVISAEVEVGVDLEPAARDVLSVVGVWASASERDLLAGTPADRRARRALQWWTRKEAVLKAVGTGLNTDPQTLVVGGGGRSSAVEIAGQIVGYVDVELDRRDDAVTVAVVGAVPRVSVRGMAPCPPAGPSR